MFRTNMVAKIAIAILLLGQGASLAQGQGVTYSITDLGTLGGPMSTACSINDRGQITGRSALANGQVHSFQWQAGAMTDLGTLGGYWVIAFSINEPGQVVGASFTASGELHAFLWQEGVMTDLGTLGGTANVAQPPLLASCNLQPHPGGLGGTAAGMFSLANSINNSGQIVGRSTAANGEDHAFVWFGGVMTDLNSLIPVGSGWTLIEAASINGSGQIVGFGTINGQTHAFLLTPNEN